MSEGPRATHGPRTGIVLGAGGVLGAAWMTGALSALQDELGVDARAAQVIQGTSAGSVLAAMLGAGLAVDVLRDHQRGIPLPGDLHIPWDHDTSTGGPTPARPRLGLGSPGLLRRVGRRELPPRTAIWAVLPPGRGSLQPLRDVVDSVVGAGRWAPREGVRTVAMDYATGDRAVFGTPEAPATSLGEAVMASCSIPGWYAPVEIAGRAYIDGGARSGTSVDLLAGAGLDEVYVLAPMASFALDRPVGVWTRLERRWRRYVTTRLMREVAVAERAGASVTVLCPGPEDLVAMGANLMDPARRRRVLETSLRTSARELHARRGRAGHLARGR
jgi:NTE family protein